MPQSADIPAARSSTPAAEPAVDAPVVHPVLAGRWSPRSFDPEHVLGDAELACLVEAARWAPSAFNAQPWRFLVGRRGDSAFQAVLSTLSATNQLWAGASSLLVAAVTAPYFPDGTPYENAAYDTGLAVAQLVVQAHAMGLHAHQMGGFDREKLRAAFGVPEGHTPVAVIAVGVRAEADRLPEKLRVREHLPRQRRPVPETFFAGAWGTPLDLDA
jgi:nitroreductase